MDYPPGLDCAPGTEISDTITNKLFIGGLDYATTEFTVQQYFSCWGPVQASIKAMPPTSKAKEMAQIEVYQVNCLSVYRD